LERRPSVPRLSEEREGQLPTIVDLSQTVVQIVIHRVRRCCVAADRTGSVTAGGWRHTADGWVANGELISSAPYSRAVLDGCRVRELSRGRSSDGSLFVHSFEVDARDQHIGNAEPNGTTRIHSTEQAIQSEIDLGAVGVRSWRKHYCCRLYNVAFRFCPAECEQFGRTASAPESFRSNTGSGCRYIEGYSVGPAATRCLAAREQLLIAAKHGSASAGFNDACVSKTERHG